MKNIIKLLFVSLILGLFTVSCENDSELLFDETASERKEAAISQFEDLFKASENGWILQYYPDNDQKYGGYTYVLDFKDNDSVVVWSELMADLSKPEASSYDVISYGGPVLTFNTYNPLMHYFATPSAQEYLAKGGDSELLLVSENGEEVVVKGVKTGNEMLFIKLTEPAVDYIAKVKKVEALVNAAMLEAKINDVPLSIFNSSRNLSISYEENGEVISITVPYIITDTGIKFYQEVEILGKKLRNFILNEEGNKLESVESDLFIDLVLPPVDLSKDLWILDLTEDSYRYEGIFNTWNAAYQENANIYGEELSTALYFGTLGGESGITFLSFPRPYQARYVMAFNGVNGKPNQLDIVKIAGGFNWQWYTHLEGVVDEVVKHSPYELEFDDADNPSQIKFTSASDSQVWFVLNKF